MKIELSVSAKKITELMSVLTDDDLITLIALFKMAQVDRDQKKKKIAEEKIKAIAKEAGLTVILDDADRLQKRKVGSKNGAKARVKYHDKQTDNTWGGRGLKPAWIKALIAEGKDLKDYLTDDFRLDSEEKETTDKVAAAEFNS